MKRKVREARVRFVERLMGLGFKQVELAVLLNRSPRTVSFYKCGQRNIPPEVWSRLSELEDSSYESLAQIITEKRKKRKPRKV